MSSLQERIRSDWQNALRNREPQKDVLSLICNELKNRAIQTRKAGDQSTTLGDDEALAVLVKMQKQRLETIETYKATTRQDLLEKEQFALAVIEKYLPQPLSDEELQRFVKDAISQTQATTAKDIGKVMGLVIRQTKGRADGKKIQQLVSQNLG